MRRVPWILITLAVCGGGWGCQPPPVVATQDPWQHKQAGHIEGTLVVQTVSRGNAVLQLYSADRPPPPQGTGQPVSFTVIRAEDLFGPSLNGTERGPFTTRYAFSWIPAGRYLIRAFLDTNTCRPGSPSASCRPSDFVPWYSVTLEPNAGDILGGALDPARQTPRVVALNAGADGTVSAATDIAVTISDAARLTLDRPVFQVEGAVSFVFDPSAGERTLELRPLPLQQGALHETQPAFFVQYVDDDHNGVPDDLDGDGHADVYPKILARRLARATPPLADANDELALTVRLDASELTPLLTLPNNQPRMDAVPIPKLRVILSPSVQDVSKRPPQTLPSVPAGRYALLLTQYTGQTWRVPNELQPALAPTLGLPSVESQQFFIEVP